MSACIIFNPVARGDKARVFRQKLDSLNGEFAFKQTTGPNAARALAAEAINEGFETIVAAGGDGTLNEVLNGIGDVPDGFARARLGVLPLGTVNVFAKELNLPGQLDADLQTLRAGREIKIDLPMVEYSCEGKTQCRYFAQMAGSGLDARAIELTNWELKKKAGPLAYVWAGILALCHRPSNIAISCDGKSAQGELVLVGNGKFYGGRYQVHPGADLTDGFLEVCVFPKANLLALIRCAGMLTGKFGPPASATVRFQSQSFTLTADSPTPLEVDGENIGHLPATFSVQRQKLRVVVP